MLEFNITNIFGPRFTWKHRDVEGEMFFADPHYEVTSKNLPGKMINDSNPFYAIAMFVQTHAIAPKLPPQRD